MNIDPPILKVPLQTDEHGVMRVADTRVTLDSLINYYLQGETPEDLHVGFPTITLIDIYAVIAYYLANQAELDAYLAQQAQLAEQSRQNAEANLTPEQRDFQQRLRKLIQL